MRMALVPFTTLLALGGLLSACGGESLPACTGDCGTVTIRAALVDTAAGPVTCAAAGVSRVALSLEFEGQETIKREIDCDPGTIELGPIAIGIYRVTARALDSAGVVMAIETRSVQLVKKDDRKELVVSLVPGPPSKLGASCDGNCGDGYNCV